MKYHREPGKDHPNCPEVFYWIKGKKELPKLDYYHGGYDYRIPTPAAIIQYGNLVVNSELPGYTIRYITDGSDPISESPKYLKPVLVKGNIHLRAFDTRGRSDKMTSLKR
jgi:hexosaminidase